MADTGGRDTQTRKGKNPEKNITPPPKAPPPGKKGN